MQQACFIKCRVCGFVVVSRSGRYGSQAMSAIRSTTSGGAAAGVCRGAGIPRGRVCIASVARGELRTFDLLSYRPTDCQTASSRSPGVLCDQRQLQSQQQEVQTKISPGTRTLIGFCLHHLLNCKGSSRSIATFVYTHIYAFQVIIVHFVHSCRTETTHAC